MNAKKVAVIGITLSLSLLLDVVPLDLPTVWGMKIDLVAVPLVVAYFITGFRGGVAGVVMLFLGLSMVSPASWLGAMMKSTATLSVIAGLELSRRILRPEFGRAGVRGLIPYAAAAYVLGLLIRVPLMVALNYYVALPLWLGIPREQVIGAVEAWTGVPFWVAIAVPNALQSAIDVFVGLAAAVPVLRRIPHLLE
ncbi:hypothetical protein E3E36_04090 [Thermococcus sp. M36]|uniref:hypothetical protein n=1 Tax=Thermococcus sp. M36 TaxID=1638261 RepID=UPI00143C627B|nr:hypothetical protein [Thermococcus sp. M36]NJE05333.1 hypothetical protein [Thermococcus sp. M36]